MRLLPLLALLTLVSACAPTQAHTAVVFQPLEVPAVPARVIVPEIEEVAPPVAEAAKPPAVRNETAPKPADKPDPTKPPTPDPPRSEDPPRVRTPETANDELAEREVRSVMARAQSMLSNVDYRALSPAARQQYDTARRFIAQADNALKIRNYVFARNLADKAETLGRQLGK